MTVEAALCLLAAYYRNVIIKIPVQGWNCSVNATAVGTIYSIPTIPVCSWLGVTCDKVSNDVITINIGRSFLLQGALPSEIGLLTDLQSLDLSYNSITGTIPTQLGLLSQLSYLDIAGNQIRGSIPTELCTLATLTYLSLHDNKMSESIPSCIGYLVQLRNIRCNNNLFRGT